ncbi:MAG: hypothetical protein CL469_05820 [Acidimicrobiaceae bacterium]|nr:hypothetical protein [Acidimicrobiaceae bacterium]
MDLNEIPKSANEISAEWLTAALTLENDQHVSEVIVEELPEGVGFMGEVARLNLKFSNGTETTVISKIPTQVPEIRSMLAPARIFEREARFFEQAQPLIPDITANCLYAAIDTENDDYLLLLEDLSDMREGDQLNGCSVDDASSALEALAKLHRTFWGDNNLANFDWLPSINSEGMRVGSEVYKQSLPGFLEAFGSSIEPENENIVQSFGDNVHQLLDRLAEMPLTVTHMDYRADNLFFGSNGSVKMIDFQTFSRHGHAEDVGYFISQNVSIEDRRNNEDGLLRTYHEALTSGGIDYSFDQLREDYRIGMLYGWVIPVFAVGTLDFSSERAVSLWTAVIERCQAAYLDHGVSDLLTA